MCTSQSLLVLAGAERQGFPPDEHMAECIGTLVNALGNGLAIEKLIDPQAVPDALFGDMLTIIFQAFAALGREHPIAQASTEG